ncbi:hexosaminidase D-like [Copidosoma floridanum]|uniref:hexosaminidase D-like n=1 Tax=Copidosoma floridanum TaxID=29053 RepID=UPI0006C9B049|nr:hexosaminidase D-like [Copidosoma floridanum]
MTRLKGRAQVSIVLMVVFALLIIVYHMLSSEVEDASSAKLRPYAKLQEDDGYHTDNPRSPQSQKLEVQRSKSRGRGIGEFDNSDVDQGSYQRNSLYKGHKVVHLDLKGAPPLVSYYKYLFPMLKKLGATGILLEYEDMFPFKGDLADVSAGNCYSKQDVMTIQDLAKENDLFIIPLIQTFGHMEFILKLKKYIEYREVQRYPQVVCPTYNKTLPLIYNVVDQVVAMHPKIRYLHIGSDEVYQLGECNRCLETMAKKQWSRRQLFLNHVRTVASYVKSKYPRVKILTWDDEFRDIEPQEIIDQGLNELVEPVVWKYTTDPISSLPDQLWDNYASVWSSVWVATAFKGATAPDRYYTDIAHHMENHQRWLEIIARHSDRIHFRGVMLTGWQRYDHFGVLCELLPAALPSLAVNLAVLQAPDYASFTADVPRRVTEALGCEGTITLSLPEPQYGWTKCTYLGASVYSAALRLHALCQEIARMEQDSTFRGWLKPYNLRHGFSSPSHVERALAELDRYKMELVYIEKEMRNAIAEGVYGNYTVLEWLETYLEPVNEKVMALWSARERILERDSWPRRPLEF